MESSSLASSGHVTTIDEMTSQPLLGRRAAAAAAVIHHEARRAAKWQQLKQAVPMDRSVRTMRPHLERMEDQFHREMEHMRMSRVHDVLMQIVVHQRHATPSL